MIRTNTLCWLIPLLLILTFPLWKIPVSKFLAPRGGLDQSMTKEEEKVTRNFSMENSVIKQFKDDQLVAVVRSKTATTGETADDFLLTKVNADIYDEDQNKTNVLAESGFYESKTEQLTLKKDVQVDRIAEKQQLFTEHLKYDGQQQKVHSPTSTTIITEDTEIKGGTFDYDIKEKRYDLGKRVNVILSGTDLKTGKDS